MNPSLNGKSVNCISNLIIMNTLCKYEYKLLISNIELNKDVIQHFFKPINNNRLDESQKDLGIIWGEQSNRDGIYG